MRIGIIGKGHVGTAMQKLFVDAYVYDSNLNIGTFEEVNKCDLVFICVPTPEKKDGSCDTSIVTELIKKLDVQTIVLRSTVYIGYTDEMIKKYNKEIVFQPEYYGETIDHPYVNLIDRNWLSFGGNTNGINNAIEAYKMVINSNVKIYTGKAADVEFAKYMENCFLATKVIFCSEMYDISKKFNVDYNSSREIWLADERIGRSHTFIFKEKRGFSGSCLPKDLHSLLYQAANKTDLTLLKAIDKKNKIIYKNEK